MAEESQTCLKWPGGSLLLVGPCVMGRRSDNDLPINNVQVSRRHALLVQYNDDWWLNDLGSRNGVMVNGVRLSSARRMRDGDEIRIANHRMIFCNARQAPLQHSSIVGKTTQVAEQALDDAMPSAAVCELIIANVKGEILEGDKVAQWFFGKTLERAPGATHYLLPTAVRQWLERAATANGSGTAPLELQNEDRRVVMSLARCKEDRCFLLVREESAKVFIERLQGLGLTEREAAVMHWVCEGKKNPEIAQILFVTVHTVNRHMEHILAKLGVDNRQKAVKAVQERMGA